MQKALALPPRLAVFACSEAAIERAQSLPNGGYYFDFIEFAKNAAKNYIPSTPAISLIFGLQHILGVIAAMDDVVGRFNLCRKPPTEPSTPPSDFHVFPGIIS